MVVYKSGTFTTAVEKVDHLEIFKERVTTATLKLTSERYSS